MKIRPKKKEDSKKMAFLWIFLGFVMGVVIMSLLYVARGSK